MIRTRALYHLLRLSAREDPNLSVEPWVLDDLRLLSLDQLFQRLNALHVRLDRKTLLTFAEECDSPEGFAILLTDEDTDPAIFDQIYLLIFELWRRLLPERPSLSIFCDELDWRIEQRNDELIQDGLANLLEILEEHVDQGMSHKEAFATLSEYCAHDLESFLFETISTLLDGENFSYARELLEEFEPFIEDPLPFEFLAARLFITADAKEASQRITALLKRELDPELLFDILHLLVSSGDPPLFQTAMKKLLPIIKTEEEFQEAMDIAADYYQRLDQEQQEKLILQLKIKRRNAPAELDPKDPDLHKFGKLMS